MLEIIPFEDSRVIAMKLDGGISTKEIEQTWKLIEDRLKIHEKLRAYVEYHNFSGMDFQGLLINIPKKFEHFTDFEREAVVSDKQWLSNVVKVGDRFFPSIEVRHFSFEDLEEAKQWIQE